MSKPEDFLNPKQREYYEQMKRSGEQTLKDLPKSEFHGVRSMDKSLIRRHIKTADKILEERTSPKLQGKQKDKAWARYKQLKAELHTEMMTKKDMRPMKTLNGRIVADMEKARELAVEQVKRIEAGQDDKIREMRNLARSLEPDDPTIGNAESLRRR